MGRRKRTTGAHGTKLTDSSTRGMLVKFDPVVRLWLRPSMNLTPMEQHLWKENHQGMIWVGNVQVVVLGVDPVVRLWLRPIHQP